MLCPKNFDGGLKKYKYNEQPPPLHSTCSDPLSDCRSTERENCKVIYAMKAIWADKALSGWGHTWRTGVCTW